MTKITHNGLWLDFSSMEKEDKKNYIISTFFAFIAGFIAGSLSFENNTNFDIFIRNGMSESDIIIIGLIFLFLSVFFWMKFVRTQDEMYQRFHNFSITSGAYSFLLLGIIFHSLSIAGVIAEAVHQDVCFPLNVLFFGVGVFIGQVYFYRKYLS